MSANKRTLEAVVDGPFDKAVSLMLDAELADDSTVRPEIEITTDATAMVDSAELALLDSRYEVYSRGRLLKEVSRQRTTRLPYLSRPMGAPAIVDVSAARLREMLATAARWTRINKKSERCATLPPSYICAMLAARPAWTFNEIAGVTETPMLRPDGSLITSPGFDEATGILYLDSGVTFPDVPEVPTLDDAKGAVSALIDPLAGFPFETPTDRSAALAVILTVLSRPAIEGPAPLFCVVAPTQGSGKTLLAKCLSLIGTGRVPAVMQAPSDESEWDKRILSFALEGLPLVLLDNLSGVLRSPTLSAALTSRSWSGRLLGVSESREAPLDATWIATGNNVTFASDIARRTVPINIDPKIENPEDRTGFKYPDLLAYVTEARPYYVAAALTVLRAYVIAHRPGHGQPPMGSFEPWDRLVRGALIWAGEADPLAGRKQLRTDSDIEYEALRAALAAWVTVYGKTPATAAEAAKRGETDEVLALGLGGLLARKDTLTGRSLGYALRRVRGRIIGGKHFTHASTLQGTVSWTVE